MNGPDTKAPGGGGAMPGMIGCNQRSVPTRVKDYNFLLVRDSKERK